MIKTPKPVFLAQKDRVYFWCPGCAHSHGVLIEGPHANTYNKDLFKPTLESSILVTSGHFSPGQNFESGCWCTYNAKYPEVDPIFSCYKCHSFIRAGRIEFLNDSTHKYKGQTLLIPEYPR